MIDLHLDEHKFDGKVTIDVAITAATATLSVHAKDLTITAATIDGDDASFECDDTTVTFTATKILTKAVQLTIVYQGILNNNMCVRFVFFFKFF